MVNEYKTIQLEGKVVFAKAVMSDFHRFPKYFLADEACFMFLSKGYFQLRTPDKVVEFREGDGMLAKCGNYFVERKADEKENLVVMAAYFHPSIVKPFFPGELSLENFKPDFDVSKFPMDEMLRIFMDSVDFLLDNPAACSNELACLKLKELLLLLAKSDQAPSIHAFIGSLFKPYEYDFRETVLKNSDTNLSLTEMATLCSMSLATFKRRFSEVFEESPARYFSRTRLEKAAALLSGDTEMRISDIVYNCGFESVTHFNKAFKKQFNQSPSEYRLSRKGNFVNH